ncbi:hypothetical protein TYRP_014834 [Tyrophagus putrescentiae]|nr:hypothetical protein TYRP_014834 [Tyrophagus putrescentiae]
MDFIIKQLTPFHGISYLEDYFEQRRKVAIGFSYQSSPWNTKFVVVDFVLTLQAVNFLYQYFRRFSQLEIIIHGDYTTVACLKREVYFFVAALCLLSAYILHRLYLPLKTKNDPDVLELLHSVLIEQKSSKFIEEQAAIAGLRRFSLVILNIFNQFGAIIFAFCVTTQIVMVFDLLDLGGPQFWANPFYIGVVLITEARFALLYAVLYLFAHAHILLATLWIVCLKMISIKLKLLCKLPTRWNCFTGPEMRHFLTNFKVDLTRTLLLVFSANRFFSSVLVFFLAINCPLNGILVSLLILNRIPLLKACFVGPVALEEFIFIFGIHLLIANVNKKIHRPAVAVLHRIFMEKARQMASTTEATNKMTPQSSTHFKISLLIQAFAFTRKRYGFTYANFGRISLMAFVRYLLLYSQLLMFVLKMV